MSRSSRPCRKGIGLLALAVLACPMAVKGIEPEDPRFAEARRAATEQRREWLRQQLHRNVTDAAQRRRLDGELDGLSRRQLEQRISDYLAARRQQRQAADRQRVESDNGPAPGRDAAAVPPGARRPAGFVPIVMWLPEGASLTASAVISPDGRFVRMRLLPFFSRIGPVDTFNFFTGESRRWHPGHHPWGFPRGRGFQERAPRRTPEIYHDGLRTRYRTR